ncbi:MAG: sulfatase, partial [Planctomycetota bacterium]
VGRWKLIEHHETGALQLFDLDADVGETENLADRERDRAAEMRRQLADWRERIDATMPTPNPNWTDDWVAATGDA